MKPVCYLLFLLMASLVVACALHKNNSTTTSVKNIRQGLTDKQATTETAALFYNLQRNAQKQVLFGHMEDNKNGYDGWQNTPGRSDVYEVTGAYPEVYGFDMGGIGSPRPNNRNDKEAQVIHDRVIEAYQRNGIITFSWHYDNPVSKGGFYWKDSPVNAVSQILPHGKYNNVLNESLKNIARFAASLQVNGKLVPVIFRPFHEFDGDWFWWGKTHCSATDFKLLYSYTVTYLRDSLHVRNFLYAFSPDCRFTNIDEYTERYPGDQYVDILGIDDYYDLRTGQSPDVAASKLKLIADMARQRNKVAAFTETGLENLPEANWYTQMLLGALKAAQTQIAYVMVWSNRPRSYWTPYKGHPAEADFKTFRNDPYIGFADKTPSMYLLN